MEFAGFNHERIEGRQEWLTPPEIVRALSVFDLDPCAPTIRPWPTAIKHYTIDDDGLSQDWRGKVWMNPPYGTSTAKWLKKLSEHGNGIALIFARTETKMFFDYIWNRADAILFLKGRLSFYNVDGTKGNSNAGAPSCLVAYGKPNVLALRDSELSGKIILLDQNSA